MLTADDLAAVPLLAHLPPAELARIAATSADIHLAAGEFLVHEGDARVDTGFANQFLHALSEVDQFESVPGRELKHMRHDKRREAGAGKLDRVFRLGRFKLRFHGHAVHATQGV